MFSKPLEAPPSTPAPAGVTQILPDIKDTSNHYLAKNLWVPRKVSCAIWAQFIFKERGLQWLQHSGRAHASRAKTREVGGLKPAECWAFFFLFFFFHPFSHHNSVLNQVPQRGESLLIMRGNCISSCAPLGLGQNKFNICTEWNLKKFSMKGSSCHLLLRGALYHHNLPLRWKRNSPHAYLKCWTNMRNGRSSEMSWHRGSVSAFHPTVPVQISPQVFQMNFRDYFWDRKNVDEAKLKKCRESWNLVFRQRHLSGCVVVGVGGVDVDVDDRHERDVEHVTRDLRREPGEEVDERKHEVIALEAETRARIEPHQSHSNNQGCWLPRRTRISCQEAMV